MAIGRSTRLEALLGLAGAILVAGPTVAGPGFGPVFAPGERSCEIWPYGGLGGLSSDGRTLVALRRCTPSAARWGWESVLEPDFAARAPIADPGVGLGRPDAGFGAYGVSGDGEVVVGARMPAVDEIFDLQAAVVGRDGVVVDLGPLSSDDPSYGTSSYATAASFDGSVLVGQAADPRPEGIVGARVAVRWTGPTRPEPLLGGGCDPEWEDCDSVAHDVSEDGRTIVGSSGRGGFRWTPETGALLLADDADPTTFVSDARGLSPNGAWVVGRGFVDGAEQPIRWSATQGLVGLGTGIPFHTPTFHAISDDGRTALGGAYPSDFRDAAWIWTADSGIEPLRSHLEALGHDTHAWRIFDTTVDVSADGLTILFTGQPWETRAPRELLHARLVAPRPGVDLCDERRAGCVTAHVVARSGQLAPSFDVGEPDFRLAFGSLCEAVIDASGRIAFMASVFSPADLALGYLDPFTLDASGACTSVFGPGPDGRPAMLFDGLYSSDDPDWPRWALHFIRSDSLGIADDGAVYVMANRLAQSRTRGEPVIVRQRGGDAAPQLLLPTPDPLAASEAIRFEVAAPDYGHPFGLDAGGNVDAWIRRTGPGVETTAGSHLGLGLLRPDGTARMRLQLGTPHPDLLPGETLSGWVHSAGHARDAVAFVGLIEGAADLRRRRAAWVVDRRDRLHRVARDLDPVDLFGLPYRFGFIDYSWLDDLVLARGGRLSFVARVDPEDPTREPRSVIWDWTPRLGLRPRLAIDALSAALPDDVGPARIVSIRGNARGDLLIEALADPPLATRRHGNAFWLLTARGQLRPLLRSGQPAPELPDGILLDSGRWDENDPATRDRHSALTGRGEALVEFFLMGPGVDASNDRALYLVDPHGRAKLVLRTGQRLEIAHGDVRTIEAYVVTWGRTGDEGRRPVNDARQVAARVIFTDDTSAIVRLEVPRTAAER